MANWAAIAYVIGGFWGLGFIGGAFTAFFEAYLGKADPRWFWVPAFWTCLAIGVTSIALTVVGYLGLTTERRTFTYAFHMLDLSQQPIDRIASQVASLALLVFPVLLVALIIDLKTCWNVCP